MGYGACAEIPPSRWNAQRRLGRMRVTHPGLRMVTGASQGIPRLRGWQMAVSLPRGLLAG